MTNINKVFLIGEVINKPEIKDFKTGGSVANIRLLTKEKIKNVNIFNWHRIVFYNNLAKLVKKVVNKGDLVFIQGKINNRKWIDEEQNVRYISEIISNEIKILKKEKYKELKDEIENLEEFNFDDQEIEDENNYKENNIKKKTTKDILDEIEDFNKNEEYFEEEESTIEDNYEKEI